MKRFDFIICFDKYAKVYRDTSNLQTRLLYRFFFVQIISIAFLHSVNL
jgi:hypothetical protein